MSFNDVTAAPFMVFFCFDENTAGRGFEILINTIKGAAVTSLMDVRT